MADLPPTKIQREYEEPANISAEVPGEQKIREIDSNFQDTVDVSTPEDTDTLSPVITITKKETTLTKGDIKVQKITVTEDISVNFQHLFKKEVTPGKTVVTSVQKLEYKY